jgi:L-aminopeptidase/D-esterase-like protein
MIVKLELKEKKLLEEKIKLLGVVPTTPHLSENQTQRIAEIAYAAAAAAVQEYIDKLTIDQL